MIVIDPAHDENEPGITGHFGTKEYVINKSIAKRVAYRLAKAGCPVSVARKEKPTLLLTIHVNDINSKTRLFCNKKGLPLAERLKSRLDSFPQIGSYQIEIISNFDLVDYPFVLIDIGGVNCSEMGLVLCPFDRTFWVLAIAEGIRDFWELRNGSSVVHQQLEKADRGMEQF